MTTTDAAECPRCMWPLAEGAVACQACGHDIEKERRAANNRAAVWLLVLVFLVAPAVVYLAKMLEG